MSDVFEQTESETAVDRPWPFDRRRVVRSPHLLTLHDEKINTDVQKSFYQSCFCVKLQQLKMTF